MTLEILEAYAQAKLYVYKSKIQLLSQYNEICELTNIQARLDNPLVVPLFIVGTPNTDKSGDIKHITKSQYKLYSYCNVKSIYDQI